MFTRAMEKNPTAVVAILLGTVVLLISPLSIQSLMTSFLAGHELRPIQALLAEIALAMVVVLCAIFTFAPFEERWDKKQIIFLALAAFAVWRLTVIHHLLNLARGYTT